MTKWRFMTLAAVLALASCKPQMFATAYLSDIEAAAAGATGKSEARLFLPMPSVEKCKEYAPAVVEAIKPQLGDVRSPECTKVEMNAALALTFDVAILKADKDRGGWPMVTIAVSDSEKSYMIELALNRTKVKAAQDAVQAKLKGAPKADLEQMLVQVSLANDLKDTASVRVGSAYVNGEAVPFADTFEVKRRAELKVTLSDVATTLLVQGGSLTFGGLNKK